MKAIKRYPNNYVANPVLHQPYFWYTDTVNTEELILKNNWAYQSGISKMEVHFDHITAIDETGTEHTLIQKSNNKILPITGIGSGQFLKTRSLSKLPKGTYHMIRIYLADKPHKLILSTGEKKVTNNLQHLDFEIKNKFHVTDKKEEVFKLWFELAPFQFGHHFIRPFLNLFKKTDRLVHRLAGAYGK